MPPRTRPTDYDDDQEGQSNPLSRVARLSWDMNEVTKRLDKIDGKLDGLAGQYVTKYELEAARKEIEAVNQKADELIRARNWIVGIILGTVLLAVLGLVITKGNL